MIQKSRINRDRPTQKTEKLINQLTSGGTFILRNWKEKRDLTPPTITLEELANVLATVISDLKKKGIIQGD